MKKLLAYFVLIVAVFAGCEDIYNPKIDWVDGVMVVDARIVDGQENNVIHLYQSLSFADESERYAEIIGAKVSLIDNHLNEIQLQESSNGIFDVDFLLNENVEYKLKIEYQGDIIESEFEPVPRKPELDSMYGIESIKIIQNGGETNVNDFRPKDGYQLYADIENDNDLKYYRFTARKIYQYTYYIPDLILGELVVYCWRTLQPRESFNIAGPTEYSSSIDIVKHPLFFMEQTAGVQGGQYFNGWILFLNQYSLSQNAYNFYKDLNSQLNADGRLFDPLYVQARNNLKCINNPDKLILGNFEISRVVERRYFVDYMGATKGYFLKEIPYFYDISQEGESVDVQPDFWETPSKVYPND